MRARQLIDGAVFGPEALKAIGQAFDEAWAEIARNFGNVPIGIDNRYRLANALLSIASEDSRDVEVVKRAALQRVALDYRPHATCASRPMRRCSGPEMPDPALLEPGGVLLNVGGCKLALKNGPSHGPSPSRR